MVGLKAGTVIMLVAVAVFGAAPAAAQNGFYDFRQAADDQYGAAPPAGTENPSTGAGDDGREATSPRVTPPETQQGGGRDAGRSEGTGRREAGAAPKADTGMPVRKTQGGSLPFTGLDLSLFALLGVALLSVGLGLQAVLRIREQRQAASG